MERQDADHFAASIAYIAQIDVRDYRGPIRTRWRIAFERQPDASWHITSIEPQELELRPATWATFGGPRSP